MVFKGLVKRLDVHRKELDIMDDKVDRLQTENADSLRDRRSIHAALETMQDTLIRHLDQLDEKNEKSNDNIVRLIKNGNGK